MNDMYKILSTKKGKTINNSTYYSISALMTTTGEIVDAVYFGNTVPKKVVSIEPKVTKAGTLYNIATIQPHQCRNRLGRFISDKR